MINQVISNPDYTSTSNQYGFYAIPKAMKPKSKYRDDGEQYEDEESNKEPAMVSLEQEPEDQRRLERDYYVNEAPWPQFKEKEPGLPVGVQVEDGELFDYQRQVEPLLQILVGQSIAKARNELQQEKERQERMEKLKEFERKRNAELMVTQRMEAQRNRKVEEVDRRKLQHKIHYEQKKLTLKKMIAHKQSKKALLGLRSEILDDLQQQGFLRHDPYIQLRTEFEPWLYENILMSLSEEKEAEKATQSILNEQQKELISKHSQHIQKQNQRRQEILAERERQRLEMEEKKRKKAIRKHRKALHAARVQRDGKLFEIVGKGERQDSINKAELSDGLAKNKPVVYISGGPFLHLVQILTALNIELTDEQIEDLIMKLLSESLPMDIPLSASLKQKLKELEQQAKQNFSSFFDRRNEIVQQLLTDDIISQQQLRLLPEGSCNKKILQQTIKAILNIYLSQNPPEEKPVEQGAQKPPEEPIVLSERDKQRLTLKPNINTQYQSGDTSNINEIIRIRHALSRQEQPEDDYIEIFDGEGWERSTQKFKKKEETDGRPILLNLGPAERSLVYDEIANQNFQNWILSLLQKMNVNVDNAKEKLQELAKQHENISKKLGPAQSISVYDVQLDQ